MKSFKEYIEYLKIKPILDGITKNIIEAEVDPFDFLENAIYDYIANNEISLEEQNTFFSIAKTIGEAIQGPTTSNIPQGPGSTPQNSTPQGFTPAPASPQQIATLKQQTGAAANYLYTALDKTLDKTKAGVPAILSNLLLLTKQIKNMNNLLPSTKPVANPSIPGPVPGSASPVPGILPGTPR